MADTMQFDLVAPERRVASEKATSVVIPGFEGDLTAMPQHAPLITTLRPGLLEVFTESGSQKYIVTGGFAEITADAATVLAERSHPVEEVTQDMIDEMVAEARAAARDAHPDVVDAAARMLADMVAMGTHIGFEPQT
ncbi:F0F1 ATP synthase subunit epsilon [Rhodovulum sp. BSW8]|uniref:ATP synthase epsilon chain n=2 Tax=Rhodovulum TaxID=34008 RepID=A0A4V3GUH5_9RHOB|nr:MULTISPECIES: F0F1 ATP synthase subunit epsilon [Rhodovulum]OLS44068.1 ATP synthase F1 subunit epsilon [Rhodovulum sulfidophilum]MBL3571625.1 F0F1 ATP synthase subunit epsilon [Rhodovulum visakhapatnamense]MBL3579963.1 F0F1 ATP synthase subunit epsilon [Rhodovulum visakhapatnamense]PTW49954.1 ATP synthase F1 subcomplex epsilon subunit [Rhodovulum kholense]RBO54428.1 F0F1 ATP synthase subunit epsilon [Rhodovulum sp. BSW8]